ncbi:uncharacterized protein SRS1_13897 [Sporisorium reilianum f. sp. reilianum]|uniref:Uncharacterized protein n=1 Tax=Sporisorium reilianum f. sp. reilianum TaxID=72559 RepID=A0A2N8UEA8_9BASI|nr:uncharacterized protein SRS1_13897 [Sporisorium reilianum f. sp. reilianum]
MTGQLIFFALMLVTAVLVRAPPPTEIWHQMQIFQTYARDVFPESQTKQADAVMTLRYLFRDEEWSSRDRFRPTDDFLRTGGLERLSLPKNNRYAPDAFILKDAEDHLQGGSVYQDESRSRRVLNEVMKKHLASARTYNKLSRERLLLPPTYQHYLPVYKDFLEMDGLDVAARPLTREHAKLLVAKWHRLPELQKAIADSA